MQNMPLCMQNTPAICANEVIGSSAGLVPINASVVSDAPHSKNAGRFGTSCGARPIQLFEGSRPWVEWTLWVLNRLWSQKACHTRSLAKNVLLMLIDLSLPTTTYVILPPAPSVLQGGSSDACVYTRESVCREAASLCAGHAQQLGGVSPSTQPDGGEGLAKRKGYRREAGSGRSVKQTCESMDKNRI
jgi:hypothetical protein